ncbi:PREDICTED: zinc finger FYVE domain-containing protein 26-like [Amphimedon queenslandica]|uniref:Uncharacterized protein n=2 Tax=Amphimedon queenslandica TaxID=400682 RepID=A0AAN0JPI1_AMPQE|nr:PREDICTED: zinc finger FYVE domain-containing protein 26-like [Amphimedon queenslandica]|eukprot:XP_019858924.1 PREDICTED: zinc finger FYVE domain-containing protein 26-like [Amphimedon queenslandica]
MINYLYPFDSFNTIRAIGFSVYGKNEDIIDQESDNYWKDAYQNAYSKHCSNNVFVDQIWLPALKCGQLDNLEEALTCIDPSLSVWEQYLTGVCRFLSQRKLFHVLYRIQLFMKDFVRAAMTCIKSACIQFFIGFSGHKTTLSDLYSRKHYLETARNHFRTAIDAKVKRNANFSTTELEGHMRTISLQMRVIDQLHKAAATNNTLNKPVPVTSMGDSGVQPSTLFGNGAVRGEVAAHLLISCQESPEAVFQIASDIISAYRLPSSKVFTEVSKQLAMKENYVGIRVLVQSIQKSHLMSPELNDEVCMAAIKVLATQTKEVMIASIN